jgi:hypothetical protein
MWRDRSRRNAVLFHCPAKVRSNPFPIARQRFLDAPQPDGRLGGRLPRKDLKNRSHTGAEVLKEVAHTSIIGVE